MSDHHFLSSIADKSVVIEVGAISQGALEYCAFEKTNKALTAVLDFVETTIKKTLPILDDEWKS